MRWLPVLLLTACGPDDSDTDSVSTCVAPGLYGSPQWSLEVREDCSAWLMGVCGEGELDSLTLTGEQLYGELVWSWQGGGVAGGEDEGVLAGRLAGDVVQATLQWADQSATVSAELGVTPGDALGLDHCMLD